MKIITWNIRHGGGTRIHKIFDVIEKYQNSDVFILTEFRNNKNRDFIKNKFNELGFEFILYPETESNINTLLIASKKKFNHEFYPSLNEHWHRLIKIEYENISLFGVYFPQKKEKEKVFKAILSVFEDTKSNIVLGGDLNTGKHYIDERGKSFHCSEYISRIEDQKMIDAWRKINGELKEYSWYSNGGNGFRIDHFFVSNNLKVRNCYYDHTVRENKFSDHSLMILELNVKS